MSRKAPTVTLNDGYQMPVLGLGTYKLRGPQCVDAVKTAIDAGYRHIDTAYLYQNEAEVGQAVREKIEDGTIKREDIFITTKLWNTSHEPEKVREAFDTSLAALKLDYVDLYLIHSPLSSTVDANGETVFTHVDYVDTWRAMEKLLETGRVRSIGVSNFNSEQLTRVIEHGTIKPVTNQVECHVRLNQKKLIKFCKDRAIVVTAYSPLVRPSATLGLDSGTSPASAFDDARVVAVAERYGKTPAQVLLRYLVDIGTVPIPKSGNAERIRQNLDIFDFALTPEEIRSLDDLHTGQRLVKLEALAAHPFYPFAAEF
ncbi:prostaglandin F synthase 1-like [Anopheles ziemanni]|uniref:prostaglandin F synthase 1-like n=1 Tax=Anopheles coustani TaxID=139045 RepID=UPI00265AE474|nr:prostaglandin F synthase 1-like [Anopheles coustani]XP_058171751.1 prostaglandin F synthase 1-like [Anopheles ziemanni]